MWLHQSEGGPGWRGLQDAAIIKAAQDFVGLHGGPSRPPFRGVNNEERLVINAVLDDLGVRQAVPA